MSAPPAASVVVGVDTSSQALAAARFGLDAARRTRSPLVLAHAWSVLDGGGRPQPAVDAAGQAEAVKVVDDLVATLDGPSGVEVSTYLRQGRPTEVLVGLSHDAGLLVVGRHDWWLERLWDGRVSAGVARLARCPVVAVGEDWRPENGWGGPVVAAVDLDASAPSVLSHAFEAADSAGTELVVLHVDGTEADVQELVRPLRRRLPEVVVRVVTVEGGASDAVRALADVASMVVVAVPDRAHRAGSVVSRLLDDGGCPLAVVPQAVALGAGHLDVV